MGAGAPVTERATRCSGLNPSIGQGLLRRPAVPSSPVAALSDAAAAHRPVGPMLLRALNEGEPAGSA